MNQTISDRHIFGNVKPPAGIDTQLTGIAVLLNNIIKLLIVGAGIYAVFNLILAGYAFLSAGDDPQKIEGAWAKIWQSILGLAIAATSIILAAIFGQLIFGAPEALLEIRIFGPGQ